MQQAAVLSLLGVLCAWVSQGEDLVDLTKEEFDFHRIWGTKDAHPSLNSDRGRNTQIASWGEKDFFVVYVDVGLRPKVAHVQRDSEDVTWMEVSNVPVVDDPAFVTRDQKDHVYSIGIDENGYLHVAGDMNEYPFYNSRRSHLPAEYRDKYCLMWKSATPAQATEFHFRGEDEETCIRGTKHVTFINDNNGKLFAHYRAIGIPPRSKNGYRVFAMSRFDTATDQWEGIGADMGDGLLAVAYELAVPDDAPKYNQYHGQVIFDPSNRLHMGIVMPGEDGAGKQSTHLVYAVSEDEGTSWQRGDGSHIDLPMRIRTEGSDKADVAYTGPELEDWAALGFLSGVHPFLLFADRSLDFKLGLVFTDGSGEWPFASLEGYLSSLGVGTSISYDDRGVMTLSATNQRIDRFFWPDKATSHSVGWKRLMVDGPYLRRTRRIAALSQRKAGSTVRGEVDLILSHQCPPPADLCHLGHLEVVFIQDLSWSAGPSLQIIKSAIPAAARGITRKYGSAKFALASFTDKPVPPLGYHRSRDYCYWLHMGLGDQSDFDSQLGSTFTRSGNDWDEDPLDAMHQAAVDPRVGWTTTAKAPDGLPVSQVIVVSTDGGVHYEKDGTKYGLVEHDGGDRLRCKTMDYPAVATVAAAILAAGSGNVKVVFLAAESAQSEYYDLANELEYYGISATVVVPSADDAVGMEEAAAEALDVCAQPARRLQHAYPSLGPHDQPRQPPALIPPKAFDPCADE